MGGLLDEAIELTKNPDNDVLFVYCGGHNQMCTFNKGCSPALCKLCTSSTRRVLLQHGIKAESLKKFAVSEGVLLEYNNAKELRALTYKDVNIGLGFMSGFISSTRNMNPLINSDTRPYFNAHIKQITKMVDSVYNCIDSYKPDCIYTFNGRYMEVRAIYDITQALHIKAYMTEGFPKNGVWEKVHFEDHLPHDIKYWVSRRDYSWEHYSMTEEEKVKLGHKFFHNRRHGIYAGDKIYIKDQKEGVIPEIDKTKINIGIMNSSEDEYAAVGADWDLLKFFPTQNEGIYWLLENADPQIHFYLRIHPNLKNIPYKFHTDLLNLEKKYSNITVIPGDSPISTYSLLDQMDKIVVFGSTMGVESAYWKVPTINLGPALYSYDDICYEPKDLEDLNRLLIEDLSPKFNDSILRYGAFSMNQDPLIIPTKNINFQASEKCIGRMKYRTYPYIKFLFGERITGFYIAVMRFLLDSRPFKRFVLPRKEA